MFVIVAKQRIPGLSMRMNWAIKTAITLFVLIVFIIMSGTCSQSCAERNNVEADLTKRAKIELEKKGFGHVDVSADHLIVTLKGFVKDKAAREEAGEIVKTMPMSDHVMGCGGHKVHPLDNQLKGVDDIRWAKHTKSRSPSRRGKHGWNKAARSTFNDS